MISNSVKSFFTVSAGGSVSNMYGMVLARYKAIPDSKTKGLSGLPPLVAFTSEDVSSEVVTAICSIQPLFLSLEIHGYFFNFQFPPIIHEIYHANCKINVST
jgi:hypothetical protein